jgi:serine/threonine protein kinase
MNEYATPVDIWSVGCIFAELAMRVPLFSGQNDISQLQEIFRILGTPNTEIWEGLATSQCFSKANWEIHQPLNMRDIIKKE